MCKYVQHVSSVGIDDRQPVDPVVYQRSDRVVQRRVGPDVYERPLILEHFPPGVQFVFLQFLHGDAGRSVVHPQDFYEICDCEHADELLLLTVPQRGCSHA